MDLVMARYESRAGQIGNCPTIYRVTELLSKFDGTNDCGIRCWAMDLNDVIVHASHRERERIQHGSEQLSALSSPLIIVSSKAGIQCY